MDCVAIIPARFASTRFPGKLVASLAGRPLIHHVVEGVRQVRGIDATVVATDDERIADAARAAGADVVVSDEDFGSGTNRVAHAARDLPAGVVVNVQGDELILDPHGFAAALDSFRAGGAELGTLCTPLIEPRDLWNPNVVKVVVDARGTALYFSRAPVPFPRAQWQAASVEAAVDAIGIAESEAVGRVSTRIDDTPTLRFADTPGLPGAYWVHLGVYFCRRDALARWAALPRSPLEKAEGLEQLRALEAGETMQTYVIDDAIPGVNTPGDLERARAVFAARASHR